MAAMLESGGADMWVKVGGIGGAFMALVTGVKYVMALGALVQRLESLTAEVERLREDLAEARLEVADLKARLG